MFEIRFQSDHNLTDQPTAVVRGEIRLNGFCEYFETSLEYWSKPDYEQQWLDGVARILDGANSSCLITSLTNPRHSNFLFWWPIYRQNGECIIHNHILLFNALTEPFDTADPYRFIPHRETTSEDGEPISEWFVSLADLRTWLDQRIAQE